MGSIEEPSYSITRETKQILIAGILNNPLVPSLPAELEAATRHVTFQANSELPSIPINWRFAESISALKGFEASMLNVLRLRKYGSPFSDVRINTDHATLFLMSPFLVSEVTENGQLRSLLPSPSQGNDAPPQKQSPFPDTDLHRSSASLHRILATNMYKTKDGRCYHIHGSMDPEPTMSALALPFEAQSHGPESYDAVTQRYQEAVSGWNAADLDGLMNEQYRQAGTIARSVEEFAASAHGRANAHVGLYELKKAPAEVASQIATWWPENSTLPSSAARPLAGLRVVDLSRIIAAPTIGHSLAEMGASVMRVTHAKVTDMHALHPTLNWGKWNCDIDIKTASGAEKLRQLIADADVVIDGYRPGALARRGFGREEIFAMTKDRERGIIHVRENCYGWNGPWQHRSGWQQISDACCGISLEYGRAMGHDEAVTPVFPNSDFCTGIAGSTAVLHALLSRATNGGSYGVDVSLNYYSQWLVRSVGTYPDDVWRETWSRHDQLTFRHYHAMLHTIPLMMKSLQKREGQRLFDPAFFEERESKAIETRFRLLKPVSQMEGVKLGFHVGTRGNGIDAPFWPADLSTEVVC